MKEQVSDLRLRSGAPGCSTGEEPYTLTIVLSEYAKNIPGYTYNILATDISTRVLEKAATAIYEESRISPIPNDLIKKYFLRGKDKSKKLVRVVPALRNMIEFRWLNFMNNDYGIKETYDIIFLSQCNNLF